MNNKCNRTQLILSKSDENGGFTALQHHSANSLVKGNPIVSLVIGNVTRRAWSASLQHRARGRCLARSHRSFEAPAMIPLKELPQREIAIC